MIGSYIGRLEAGEDIARPREAVVAERDRITAEHRELLPEEQRDAFDEQLALARTVFPYVENHNFYVDHWYLTDLLEQGARVRRAARAARRSWPTSEDVFFLRHDEVRSALEELRLVWSSGGAGAALGPVALARDRRAPQADL